MSENIESVVIVGNLSDQPTALDVAHFFGQKEDVSDVIHMKTFGNTEFCPRFIADDGSMVNVNSIGNSLQNKAVVIVSSSASSCTRNDLALRNCLTARAAKDNGAAWVILVEPDLFFSAQDRGPGVEHGKTRYKRDVGDRYKFNGQAFSSRMYADILKSSGVDEVFTVHNHSDSVKDVFNTVFEGHFKDLLPHRLYARYINESKVIDTSKLVLCAPDKGALSFVEKTKEALLEVNPNLDIPTIIMDKVRSGERQVSMQISPSSPYPLELVKDKHVIVIDDMVRSGSTIVRACDLLKEHQPEKVAFLVSHFHSSDEGRQNMANKSIDEIITTSTIPSILNRDKQGRLRKKMAVLKIERWMAHHLRIRFNLAKGDLQGKWYQEDISSKNPRSLFTY